MKIQNMDEADFLVHILKFLETGGVQCEDGYQTEDGNSSGYFVDPYNGRRFKVSVKECGEDV